MYRIYMIEDDNGILEAVKSQGERWGLQVLGVRNFRKILAEFSEIQPHMVIMDIGLPAFDGYHWRSAGYPSVRSCSCPRRRTT